MQECERDGRRTRFVHVRRFVSRDAVCAFVVCAALTMRPAVAADYVFEAEHVAQLGALAVVSQPSVMGGGAAIELKLNLRRGVGLGEGVPCCFHCSERRRR